MTAIPDAADFTGSTITEAQFKTAMTDLRSYLVGLLDTEGEPINALKQLDALLVKQSSKTLDYSIQSVDLGRLLSHNSATAHTFTLPDPSVVGGGWNCAFRNRNTGTLTIARNSAELIDDSSANITLEESATCFIICTGTNWYTVSKTIPIGAGDIDTTELADGAATLAKTSGVIGDMQNASTNTPSAATTSWVTYLSDTITVESASSKIIAIANIRFAVTSGTFDARLVVDGTAVDSLDESTVSDSGVLMGTLTAAGTGTRTVTVQIKKDLIGHSSQANTGDIILLEQTA